ncbi:MAG: hypothetical protein GY906_36240, partial [bacterium]|nr:hypothetical protein [bacterium]
MNLNELPTPCAIINLDVLERNASRMAERAHRLGVRLRPHVKTHKCLEAARLLVAGHFGGITVSTLAEARFFSEGGFRDILYAVPIAPSKLDEVIGIADQIDRFAILVDSEAVVEHVENAGKKRGTPIDVFLKVDSGGGRAGVDPCDANSIAIAAALDRSSAIEFRGILTHAGQSYECLNAAGAREVAVVERDIMVAFAARLRASGIDVGEISIGSTPTA